MVRLSDCSLNNTIVASVLVPGGLPTILPLAHSAQAAGFACIAVQAMELADVRSATADAPLLRLLELPRQPLLPRSLWCNSSGYIARRASFYRLRLWRIVLEAGHDLLAVDASRRLIRNPLPAIRSLTTRHDNQYGHGASPDVIGYTPGWFLKQFGFAAGLWVRSTPATKSVIHRAEARVRGCEAEVVFTEELNWGMASVNASMLPCCHHECLGAMFTKSPVAKASQVRSRTHPKEGCASDDSPPLAPPPPNASRHGWARNGTIKRYGTTRAGQPLYQAAWRADTYNTLTIPMHRFGRCTGRDASCIGLHADCPPPSPPFTREMAIAGRKAEAERARLRGIRHRAERAARNQVKGVKSVKG